eukprot:symbB.v1.2.027648.t1/scaffold2801.1/size140286/2
MEAVRSNEAEVGILAGYARSQESNVLTERSPAGSAGALPSSPGGRQASATPRFVASSSVPSSPGGAQSGIHLAPYVGPASIHAPPA